MSGFAHDAPGTSPERWRTHPGWDAVPAAPLTAGDGRAVRELVVVAAHPDDETLGAGGLVAQAHDRGLPVRVVVLTDGEGSHPRSPTHTRADLAALRRREADDAVGLLAPGARVDHTGFPDGGLPDHPDLVAHLVALIGDGRHTLLAAPWRRDGHPDHEAAGHASAVAAARTGAALWEYPIWFWHWGAPEDAPWPDLVAAPLTEGQRARKGSAVAVHRTQVAPLSARPGDEVLLTAEVLRHFGGPHEIFVRARPAREAEGDEALDALHRDGSEPWEPEHRWYERRKRRLLLASLPSPSHDRVLEVGCSTGVLALDLASRCRELVAVDASRAALETAADRLRDVRHARVERHEVPWSWPAGEFDLVVLSEVGYFMSPVALDEAVERIRGCLAPEGCVVLCHWRHEVVGWPLDGPAVHQRFRRAGLRPEIACYRDRDVEILVLAPPACAPEADR